ncbi:SAM-dependent methyltransferase [Dactylosporangium sp. NPDC051541]|uniref:SAM-dependent methyltransferase n=1 Tax=Dactylosporangium sp. NPDC051541 TaxID=3363977 RepID=UPI0037A7FEA8
MQDNNSRTARKAATAARMYDYFLGGIHNFEADRAAADMVLRQYPSLRDAARANRAFVVDAVRHVAGAGVRQFLDLGSGIPTVDNVHTVARRTHPDARVVYVDIDPDAVAESIDILGGDRHAVAIRGDVQDPEAVLGHPDVRRTLDFDAPIGLLMAAILHFIPDHATADRVAERFVAALPAGSFVVLSHTGTESFALIDRSTIDENVYQRRTSTPGTVRTRAEVERLFAGLELVEPGVVWAQQWQAGATVTDVTPLGPGGVWAGVARKV